MGLNYKKYIEKKKNDWHLANVAAIADYSLSSCCDIHSPGIQCSSTLKLKLDSYVITPLVLKVSLITLTNRAL